MKQIHISNVDLNLLTVFDAVMTERHTARAAARIGLTQPAVSHALRRLRLLFGDPLFVRSPRGMVPTPRAEDMAQTVREALSQVEILLHGEKAFDPGSSVRRFEIGMSDYASLVLLPKIMRALSVQAPGIDVTVKNAAHGSGAAMLEEGAVELIAGNFPEPPPHMRSELLFMEGFMCAGRADHPALERKLTVRRYLACEHLQVSTAGNPHGYVDAVLARRGLERRVRVTVGHFLAAPLLLEHTDLIATEPRRMFEALKDRAPIRLVPPPFPLPDFPVTLNWHSRYDADPGHSWLRGVFRRCFPGPA